MQKAICIFHIAAYCRLRRRIIPVPTWLVNTCASMWKKERDHLFEFLIFSLSSDITRYDLKNHL